MGKIQFGDATIWAGFIAKMGQKLGFVRYCGRGRQAQLGDVALRSATSQREQGGHPATRMRYRPLIDLSRRYASFSARMASSSPPRSG